MPTVEVTVVTPTRNRPQLLRRALDSIANQTLQNYQVLIVDDGSEAGDAEAYRTLVAGFDGRFNLLQPLRPGELGSGPSLSRNRALAVGVGRYFAFLDDDDVWNWDDHLRTAVELLDATGAELYCADMQGFRGDTLIVETWFPERTAFTSEARIRVDPPAYRLTRAQFVDASRHRNLNPDPIVVSRALVERAGAYLPTLRYAEDYEFLMRIADRTEWVVFCDKTVARYRLPEEGSHSVSMGRLEQHLQSLAAAQHLRATARSREVRSAAKRLESWTLRSISETLKNDGQRGAARSLAVQALAVRLTLGGIVHLGRTLFPV
jgi:glycosyltransferase involved in cell wall biosynthesis